MRVFSVVIHWANETKETHVPVISARGRGKPFVRAITAQFNVQLIGPLFENEKKITQGRRDHSVFNPRVSRFLLWYRRHLHAMPFGCDHGFFMHSFKIQEPYSLLHSIQPTDQIFNVLCTSLALCFSSFFFPTFWNNTSFCHSFLPSGTERWPRQSYEGYLMFITGLAPLSCVPVYLTGAER